MRVARAEVLGLVTVTFGFEHEGGEAASESSRDQHGLGDAAPLLTGLAELYLDASAPGPRAAAWNAVRAEILRQAVQGGV